MWTECVLQRELVRSWEEHVSIPLSHPSRVGAQQCISGTQSHDHLRKYRERRRATVATPAEYLRSGFDREPSNRAELPNILSVRQNEKI